MDCRIFRSQHLDYLDATLPSHQMTAMQAHVTACVCCARLEVALRRGLMIAHSLPSIRPSAGFGARLRAVYSAHATDGDARAQDGTKEKGVRSCLSLPR